MNYLLLSRGFPHVIIDVTRRSAYLASLDEANAGRLERYALFLAQSVERSIQRLLPE